MLDFFTTSTTNLIAAEKAAGVGHHVALTIVGTNRPQNIPYFHAKVAQEKLIRESGVPYSLVHATQFFEFLGSIADISTDGDIVRLPGALIQPMAAEDVATAVARTAAGSPVGDIEVAGPEAFGLDEFIRRGLSLPRRPTDRASAMTTRPTTAPTSRSARCSLSTVPRSSRRASRSGSRSTRPAAEDSLRAVAASRAALRRNRPRQLAVQRESVAPAL